MFPKLETLLCVAPDGTLEAWEQRDGRRIVPLIYKATLALSDGSTYEYTIFERPEFWGREVIDSWTAA
jgi:hypothetical protein